MGAQTIERLEFADGTVWSAHDLSDQAARVQGTVFDDALSGSDDMDALYGMAGADTLSALGGDDLLDGGEGIDRLIGGPGNDIYIVDSSRDAVVESGNAGTDEVRASATYTLPNNVERLSLQGSANLSGTGNALANLLTGNSGANSLSGGAGADTLDGGAGADTLTGGAGDDCFIVDAAGDVTTDGPGGGGTDSVLSAVTRTLASDLENLTLTGTAAIDGTGNAAGNILTGNSAANALAGLGGNDTYDGAAGDDTLTDSSTTSNDAYRFGLGYGADTIKDAGGSDRIELGSGITLDMLSFNRVGDGLRLSLQGHSDTLTVAKWYSASANRIETIRLADGSTVPGSRIPAASGAVPAAVSGSAGTAGTVMQRDVQALVQAMAGFDAGVGRSSGPELQALPVQGGVLAAAVAMLLP